MHTGGLCGDRRIVEFTGVWRGYLKGTTRLRQHEPGCRDLEQACKQRAHRRGWSLGSLCFTRLLLDPRDGEGAALPDLRGDHTGTQKRSGIFLGESRGYGDAMPAP